MRRHLGALSVVLAFAISVVPSALSAQGPFGTRRPAPPAPTGWAPIELGIHVGYEYSTRGTVLGDQMRIPLLKSGYLELVPNGDITWGRGIEIYTGGAELVALSGGRRGGLFAGGGLAWRNSQQDSRPPSSWELDPPPFSARRSAPRSTFAGFRSTVP